MLLLMLYLVHLCHNFFECVFFFPLPSTVVPWLLKLLPEVGCRVQSEKVNWWFIRLVFGSNWVTCKQCNSILCSLCSQYTVGYLVWQYIAFCAKYTCHSDYGRELHACWWWCNSPSVLPETVFSCKEGNVWCFFLMLNKLSHVASSSLSCLWARLWDHLS